MQCNICSLELDFVLKKQDSVVHVYHVLCTQILRVASLLGFKASSDVILLQVKLQVWCAAEFAILFQFVTLIFLPNKKRNIFSCRNGGSDRNFKTYLSEYSIFTAIAYCILCGKCRISIQCVCFAGSLLILFLLIPPPAPACLHPFFHQQSHRPSI